MNALRRYPMRWITMVLAVLILIMQYPMWLGKGGWLSVRELERSIETEQANNQKLKARNDALDAEVRDLKQGFAAIEERARSELGMIRPDEVFFQLPENALASANSKSPDKPGSR